MVAIIGHRVQRSIDRYYSGEYVSERGRGAAYTPKDTRETLNQSMYTHHPIPLEVGCERSCV